MTFEEMAKQLISILENLDNEKFINIYNAYAIETNNNLIYHMEDLNKMASDLTPSQLISIGIIGDFSIYDYYFILDNCKSKSAKWAYYLVDLNELARHIIAFNYDYGNNEIRELLYNEIL